LVEDRRKRVEDETVMARPAVQTSSDAPSDLIERGEELSVLSESVETVRSNSRGRLVFVAGEAGVGKTALVTRFCEDRADGGRVLWGACDALFTPRPLGPFLDIAESAGGELAQAVESGAGTFELAAR
jgi:predicted ATPase